MLQDNAAFVTLDGVSHVYGGAGGTLAVEDLSINVNRGEFAAVVGPSGCGKSTLMKLATGLQFPFKGAVRVAGEVVSKPVASFIRVDLPQPDGPTTAANSPRFTLIERPSTASVPPAPP